MSRSNVFVDVSVLEQSGDGQRIMREVAELIRTGEAEAHEVPAYLRDKVAAANERRAEAGLPEIVVAGL